VHHAPSESIPIPWALQLRMCALTVQLAKQQTLRELLTLVIVCRNARQERTATTTKIVFLVFQESFPVRMSTKLPVNHASQEHILRMPAPPFVKIASPENTLLPVLHFAAHVLETRTNQKMDQGLVFNVM
jgi:hypothetical protein